MEFLVRMSYATRIYPLLLITLHRLYSMSYVSHHVYMCRYSTYSRYVILRHDRQTSLFLHMKCSQFVHTFLHRYVHPYIFIYDIFSSDEETDLRRIPKNLLHTTSSPPSKKAFYQMFSLLFLWTKICVRSSTHVGSRESERVFYNVVRNAHIYMQAPTYILSPLRIKNIEYRCMYKISTSMYSNYLHRSTQYSSEKICRYSNSLYRENYYRLCLYTCFIEARCNVRVNFCTTMKLLRLHMYINWIQKAIKQLSDEKFNTSVYWG